jgi:hypothetical protein
MDTLYITDRALIGVLDVLTTRLYRGESASLPADFGTDPSVLFTLEAPGIPSPAVRRPFTWFIRRHAAAIAERLDAARGASRDDGLDREVDLSGLATEQGWPVLRLQVRAAAAA